MNLVSCTPSLSLSLSLNPHHGIDGLVAAPQEQHGELDVDGRSREPDGLRWQRKGEAGRDGKIGVVRR